MAHFAQLNDDSIVTEVIVVHNNELLGDDGQESEFKGQEFCRQLLGGTWLQTSYNGSMRKNYAAPGYTYDSQRDAFIPPQPYSSWRLNESDCRWYAPTPYPQEGGAYYWDEPTTSWVEINLEQKPTT